MPFMNIWTKWCFRNSNLFAVCKKKHSIIHVHVKLEYCLSFSEKNVKNQVHVLVMHFANFFLQYYVNYLIWALCFVVALSYHEGKAVLTTSIGRLLQIIPWCKTYQEIFLFCNCRPELDFTRMNQVFVMAFSIIGSLIVIFKIQVQND